MILTQLKADPATIQKIRANFQVSQLSEQDIKQTIQDFQRLKGNLQIKDIFQYPNWVSVKNRVMASQQTKSQQKKVAKKDPKAIYQDQQLAVYMPKTHGQSCTYAQGAKWCTAQSSTPTHWSSYHQQRDMAFYYVRNKTKALGDQNSMIRVVVSPKNVKQYYNYNDRSIAQPDFLSKIINIFQPLSPRFIQNKRTNLFSIVATQSPNGHVKYQNQRFWATSFKNKYYIFKVGGDNFQLTYQSENKIVVANLGGSQKMFVIEEYMRGQYRRSDTKVMIPITPYGDKSKSASTFINVGKKVYAITKASKTESFLTYQGKKSQSYKKIQPKVIGGGDVNFWVNKNNGWGILDQDLNQILKPIYDKIIFRPGGGRGGWFVRHKDEQQYVYNQKGKGGKTVQRVIDNRMQDINRLLGLQQSVQYNRLAQLRGLNQRYIDNNPQKRLNNIQFILLYLLFKPGAGSGQIRTALKQYVLKYKYGEKVQPQSSQKPTKSYPSYFGMGKQGPGELVGNIWQRLPNGKYILTQGGAERIKRQNLLQRKSQVQPYVRK